MYQNKELLLLTHQQLSLIERIHEEKLNNITHSRIYAVTPTYYRSVQKAELTRLSQTLRLIPDIFWIVVEDSDNKTDLVKNLLSESHVTFKHLNAKTPPFEKLQAKVH